MSSLAGTDRRTTVAKIETMTTARIAERLMDQGYGALIGRAEEIRAAAQNGALLWTRKRLTTTDGSRIDARPRKGV